MGPHWPRRPRFAPALVVIAAASIACGSEPAKTMDRTTNAALSRAPFGQAPGGPPVEIFTLTSGHGMELRTMPYGAIIVSVRVPDRSGALDDVVLGFDTLDDYVAKNSVFRRRGRTLRQPDRQGPVHARRQDVPARDQQRRESSARRREGFRQGRLAGRTVRTRRPRRRRLHAHEPGRRRRLSRCVEHERHLHRLAVERADRRLRGDDRQGHADQPHAAQLLQPGRRRQRRYPRSSADDRRGSLHAGGRHADSHRRAGAGRRHAVRFPPADRDRRAHRGRRHAAPLRKRVRPQLGAEPYGRGLQRPAPCCARRRSEDRPHARRVDHGAGRAVLYGQLSRRDGGGEGGTRIPAPQRAVPRDAAFPRLTEPSELSLDDSATR